jgi:hypothetical protein
VGDEVQHLLEFTFERTFFYSRVGHGHASPFMGDHFATM